MPTCTIMVGIPGSGKSTMAHKIADNIDARIISLDIIRKDPAMMAAATRYNGNAKLSTERRAEIVLVRDAMKQNEDVIIDDTNIKRTIRGIHIRLAFENSYTANCIFMDTPISIAAKRNKIRDDKVPSIALYDHSSKLERPSLDEGFTSLCVVFHLTGTNYLGSRH